MCNAGRQPSVGSVDAICLPLAHQHVAGPAERTWRSGGPVVMIEDTHATDPGITRRTALAGIGAGGIGLLLVARSLSLAGAQEATPTGPVGVSMQLMGTGQPATAPGLELTLRRLTIAPGGSIPPHSHPGALVIFVEAGTSTYTPLAGSIQVTRGVPAGTPAPAEAVAIGTALTLNTGDMLFVEDPQDDVRNDGDEDLVLLIAGLTRQGEPFTMLTADMDMEATPES
jgi:quercetin dioxygenase-like cupin family protein